MADDPAVDLDQQPLLGPVGRVAQGAEERLAVGPVEDVEQGLVDRLVVGLGAEAELDRAAAEGEPDRPARRLSSGRPPRRRDRDRRGDCRPKTGAGRNATASTRRLDSSLYGRRRPAPPQTRRDDLRDFSTVEHRSVGTDVARGIGTVAPRSPADAELAHRVPSGGRTRTRGCWADAFRSQVRSSRARSLGASELALRDERPQGLVAAGGSRGTGRAAARRVATGPAIAAPLGLDQLRGPRRRVGSARWRSGL